jgi:hypothetical protein
MMRIIVASHNEKEETGENYITRSYSPYVPSETR